MLVVSSKDLVPGDSVTVDYTMFTLGGKDSHRQARGEHLVVVSQSRPPSQMAVRTGLR